MPPVKLDYPKIQGSGSAPLAPCIAFEKYDGTNLHWVWDREIGWYGFGTRRDRFDLDELGTADFNAAHPGLESAAELFLKTFAMPLDKIFRQQTLYSSDEITVFTEYLGDESFAGLHKKDDQMRLVLFDVQTAAGIVPPAQFVDDFSHLTIARVIYRGKLTGRFVSDVREGQFDVGEGVICKGGTEFGRVWMAKIKTNAYMIRLKQAFKDDWERYWE